MSITDKSYLYVEDDANSRQVMDLIMTTIMQVEHYTVFEDSEDFLTRLEALSPRPDVILLDIHMQPISGFEMLTLIRTVTSVADRPVVALTASVMNEEVDALREAGFDGAIAKPLNARLFPSLIEQIVDGDTVWHIS